RRRHDKSGKRSDEEEENGKRPTDAPTDGAVRARLRRARAWGRHEAIPPRFLRITRRTAPATPSVRVPSIREEPVRPRSGGAGRASQAYDHGRVGRAEQRRGSAGPRRALGAPPPSPRAVDRDSPGGGSPCKSTAVRITPPCRVSASW